MGLVSGFELWRLINKDKDPVRCEQAFFMDIALQNMSHKKSNHFSETYNAMIDLETKVIEYRAVIGSPTNHESLGKILWAMADTDTQEKAEDFEKLNFMDDDDFRTCLVERQGKLVGRQGVRTPHSHNRMVDAVQIGVGGNPMPEAACAPAAWSGAAADPWAGGTGTDPWAVGATGAGDFGAGKENGQLDAFGKGGKGKKGKRKRR